MGLGESLVIFYSLQFVTVASCEKIKIFYLKITIQTFIFVFFLKNKTQVVSLNVHKKTPNENFITLIICEGLEISSTKN